MIKAYKLSENVIQSVKIVRRSFMALDGSVVASLAKEMCIRDRAVPAIILIVGLLMIINEKLCPASDQSCSFKTALFLYR